MHGQFKCIGLHALSLADKTHAHWIWLLNCLCECVLPAKFNTDSQSTIFNIP